MFRSGDINQMEKRFIILKYKDESRVEVEIPVLCLSDKPLAMIAAQSQKQLSDTRKGSSIFFCLGKC